ncbi:MAG: hypothetical protein C4576_14505 [Desulfobacteraceae bacterium]|nr:MAG: hypothetical protein C4576_14505 [Desulfobacteraceae bacterium]
MQDTGCKTRKASQIFLHFEPCILDLDPVSCIQHPETWIFHLGSWISFCYYSDAENVESFPLGRLLR